MKKNVFKLIGLTNQQRQFLKDFSKKKYGRENMTKAILEIINQELENQKNIKTSNIKTSFIDENPSGKTRKLQVSFLENDYKNLQLLADKTDSSKQRFIKCVIRNILYNSPEFFGDEIEQLRKSNYQLHKIGVNINQIAKAINSGELVDINSTINELNLLIKKHTEKVENLLKKNINRH